LGLKVNYQSFEIKLNILDSLYFIQLIIQHLKYPVQGQL